jgi:hypothetical protein
VRGTSRSAAGGRHRLGGRATAVRRLPRSGWLPGGPLVAQLAAGMLRRVCAVRAVRAGQLATVCDQREELIARLELVGDGDDCSSRSAGRARHYVRDLPSDHPFPRGDGGPEAGLLWQHPQSAAGRRSPLEVVLRQRRGGREPHVECRTTSWSQLGKMFQPGVQSFDATGNHRHRPANQKIPQPRIAAAHRCSGDGRDDDGLDQRPGPTSTTRGARLSSTPFPRLPRYSRARLHLL